MDAIDFAGDSEQAIEYARAALIRIPGIKIVEEQDGYLRATATTLLMRFVDDIEIYFDSSAQKLHFRSASRLGKSDLGANRTRMERFVYMFNRLAG